MNQPAFEDFEINIKEKFHIMKGIFHNMECGMKMEEINPAFGELDGNHMLVNPFLSAVIFELAIKSLWELSHSRVFDNPEITKYGHCIHKIYPCLNEGFYNVIRNKYELEVMHFHNELHEILHSHEYKDLTKNEKVSILSCPYFSLEDCLKENPKIVKNGKYEFQQSSKINVVTGIIPKLAANNNQVSTHRQPSPFLMEIIDCIENELNHSIFEHRIV